MERRSTLFGIIELLLLQGHRFQKTESVRKDGAYMDAIKWTNSNDKDSVPVCKEETNRSMDGDSFPVRREVIDRNANGGNCKMGWGHTFYTCSL